MSPLVHAELSWLMAQGLSARRDRILVTCAGVAPDLDGLSILGGLDAYAKWHHLIFHGIVGAVVTAAVCALFASRRAAVALLALAAFHLHILCDLAGSGPGWSIYYFWPFNRDEWFWSGQWDLASWPNFGIAFAATATCVAMALVLQRTPVELFSARADALVTQTLRRRLLGRRVL